MFYMLLNIKPYHSGIITCVSLIQLIKIFTNTTGGHKIHVKEGMKYKGGVIKPIVNYDAKLNSHYEAWSYKEKKHKNIKAHKNSV